MKLSFIPLIYLIFFLSGCSLIAPEQKASTTNADVNSEIQSIAQRNQQMYQLQQWQLQGKIAFIDTNKRESANIYWQYTNQAEQTLKLTTYLGINVLQIHSKNNLHTIEVSGERYQSNNLPELIFHLTQLNLPTDALNFWIKGLAYLPSDKVEFDPITQLPKTLTSQLNRQSWQILFDHYQTVEDHQLATKLTLTHGSLTIKININQWKL